MCVKFMQTNGEHNEWTHLCPSMCMSVCVVWLCVCVCVWRCLESLQISFAVYHTVLKTENEMKYNKLNGIQNTDSK